MLIASIDVHEKDARQEQIPVDDYKISNLNAHLLIAWFSNTNCKKNKINQLFSSSLKNQKQQIFQHAQTIFKI